MLSIWTTRLLQLLIVQLLAGTPAGAAGFLPDLSLNARIFAYALSISLLAGVFFGLVPALQFTRPGLIAAIKDDGSPFGGPASRSRFRGLLIGAQVAVSMLLLITAGLLARGLVKSSAADPGFDTRRVFLLAADFNAARRSQEEQRLLEHLRGVPEIVSTTVGGYPMMGTWTPFIVIRQPGSLPPLHGRTLASFGTETYLPTLGIPLLRGRGFTAQESRSSAPVAIVSESAARRFWAGQDPVGRTFQLDMDFAGAMSEFQVIGVARDVRLANLTRPDPAHVYLTPQPGRGEGIVLRASGDPRRALQAIRASVAAFDRNLLPGLFLTSVADGPMLREKSQARILAVFAAVLASLALLLAAVGIYGVMSYLVAQRTREIGVRMALGASAAGVLRGVVLRNQKPVFAGLALGILGAAAFSTLLHATLILPGSTDPLYGVPFYDPATFFGLTLFLLTVAAAAGAVPARRAVRIDPMAALRAG